MASIGGLPAGAAAAAGYAGALPPLVARGPVPAYPPGAAGAAGYAGMTAAAPVDPRVKLQQQRALDARANPANVSRAAAAPSHVGCYNRPREL